MKKFDIALRIRAKHGIIYNYMQENKLTLKDLAKLTGISVATLIKVINFKWLPATTAAKGGYQKKKIEIKLCNFFKCDVEDLFPAELIRVIENDSEITQLLQEEQTVTKSVDLAYLSFGEMRQLEASYEIDFDEEIYRQELSENVENLLSMFSDTEKKIIKMYCGIGYDKTFTFDEIGQEIGRAGSRVGQILHRTLEKMRRYKPLSQIQKFYEPSGEVILEAKKRIIKNYEKLEKEINFSLENEIRRDLRIFNLKLEDVGLSQEILKKAVKDAWEKRWRRKF